MTGRDLVTASAKLLGVIAQGETLNADEAVDGLASINRMLDSWSNEGLLINAITQESPFTLTAGDGTVTLGTAGDISNRPMSIHSAIIRDGGTDYNLNSMSLTEYNSISDKSVASLPSYYIDDGGYPLKTLYLYPVPSAAYQLILWTKRAITQIATLDTALSMPPGYERAIIYNAAIELSSEYGRPVAEIIFKIANESKSILKRSNYKTEYLKTDEAMLQPGRFNILTGDYTR